MDEINGRYGVPESVPDVPEMSQEDVLRAVELFKRLKDQSGSDAVLLQRFMFREIVRLWHMVHDRDALLSNLEKKVEEFEPKPYSFTPFNNR